MLFSAVCGERERGLTVCAGSRGQARRACAEATAREGEEEASRLPRHELCLFDIVQAQNDASGDGIR